MTGKRRRLMLLLGLCTVLFVMYYHVSYHGPQSASEAPGGGISIAKVVAEGRKLKGVLYDPLHGQIYNIGGRLGFVVCIDVPRLAYQNAGMPFRKMLEDDFRKHLEFYDARDGNSPGNPSFHRRARNLYSYCAANGLLVPLSESPRPGDVVFYGYPAVHITLVSEVGEDGGYKVIEAEPANVYVVETTAEDVIKRGWIPVAYGRLIKGDEGASGNTSPMRRL